MRAVLYLRLSSSDEASTSISRQESDLLALAAREGWDVVATFADDGVSGRKARANATEALRMIRDDEADVLAVWKFDRWTRQGLSAVGDLVATLDEAPGKLFVALQDGLRSDQAAWRIIAVVLAEVARTEAENTALRVRSAVRDMRHSGRWPGGIVPYGYWPAPAPDGPGRVLVPHAPEAAMIRELADRILGGESLTRIVKDVHDRGIPASRSDYRKAEIAGRDPEGLDRGTWRLSALKQVMTADFLLGRVTSGKQLVRDENGVPRQVFAPILDLDTLTRLRSRLGDPRAPKGQPARRRAARLLSGIAYCGLCDHKMHIGMSNGKNSYRCANQGVTTCPGVRVLSEPLEEYVVERYLALVGDSAEIEIAEFADDSGTAAELAEIETALAETLAALGDDDADAPALLRRLDALKSKRADLRARPTETYSEAAPTGRTLREAFTSSDEVDSQRATLLQALDHVRVHSRTIRGSSFDPARVELVWNS